LFPINIFFFDVNPLASDINYLN